ncbi:MAG: diguanylate cyclase domain-containing protein [Acidimicrobiales bacterium]
MGGLGDGDLLDFAFETTLSGVALIDADALVLRVNAVGAAIVGRTPEELVGRHLGEIAHADDGDAALDALEDVMGRGHTGPVEVRVLGPDGATIWLRCKGTLLPTDPPTTFLVFEDAGPQRDVADRLDRTTQELQREHAELERRVAQQAAVAELGTMALRGAPLEDLADHCRKLVETTLDVAHCGVLVDDGHPDGLLLIACSERFNPQVGGYRHATDPGLVAVFEADGSILVPDLTLEQRFAPNPMMVEMGMRSMAAAPIEPRSGLKGVLSAGDDAIAAFGSEDLTFLEAMANVIASAIDAKRALDELRHDAMHDPLTGLPNRVLLLDRLELALEQASGRASQVAVLVCDVDHFKLVNDGLGHAAGDEVLRVVADRLKSHVRPGDTVGRYGGDEFVVVCPDVTEIGSVVAIAERLGTAFADSMRVLGTDLVATASIGIAVGDHLGPDGAAGLLRDADVAMYCAKDRGRARYEVFDASMRRRIADHPNPSPPSNG